MRYRVKDVWHPKINGDTTPWVYSDHSNFNGDVEEFFCWVAMHNNWRLDGVETVNLSPRDFKLLIEEDDDEEFD
jgi:hypothetical protein